MKIRETNIDTNNLSSKCEFCHELASAYAPISSLTDTYNLIFDFLGKVVAYDSSTLFIKFTDKLQAVACRGFSPEDEKEVLNMVLGLDNLPLLDTLRKGGPVVVSDVTRFEYLQDKTRVGKIRSWMGVPFFVNNDLVALLTVDKQEPDFYSEKDTSWIKSFAAFSAINIQRAYQYQELQKKLLEQEAITGITSLLIKAMSLQETLQVIFEEISKILHGCSGTIFLLDEKSENMKIVASMGISEEDINKINETGIPVTLGTFGIVYETREMLEITNAREDPRIDRSFGTIPESLTNIPLIADDHFLGVITLDTVPKSDDQRKLLKSLADLVYISIEQSLHYEKEKKLMRDLKAMIEITRNITSLYDTDKVLERITREIQENYHALYTSIFLIDQENKELVYKWGSGFGWESLKDNLKIKLGGQGVTSWVVENDEPLIVNDVRKDPRYLKSSATSKVRSELAIPIKIKGEIVGVLDVESENLNAFDSDHLLVFQLLSDHLGVVIENSKLYEEVKQIAIRDGLTNLYNHRYFYELLEDELHRFYRYNGHLSIFMIDINDFKKYNDTYGHLEGDKILKKVAEIFLTNCRSIDVISRYGGDEFAILLPHTRTSDARMIANRLWSKAMDEKISLSVGIVSMSKDLILKKEELLQCADNAMYQAKKAGGGIQMHQNFQEPGV